MSMETWLCRGFSMPRKTTAGEKFNYWLGRRMAMRNKNVHIAKSSSVSPNAFIHPRDGKITIGENAMVGSGALIQGDVTMGDNCSLQLYSIIVGSKTAPVTIGDNVRIAPHTRIISANHRFDDITKPICKQGMTFAPINIASDVWIAAGVSITAGVSIGTGAVIAAGSVVTHSVGDYEVVAGVPAKVIKKRG